MPNPLTNTPKHLHRSGYFAQCGKHLIKTCEHCAVQFTNRMHALISAFEKHEPIERMQLESLRIREFSALLKEAGHG